LQDLTASLNVSIFNAGIGLGAVVGGKVIDAAGLYEVGIAGALSGVLAIVVAGIIVSSTKRFEAAYPARGDQRSRPTPKGCGL
jgi:predicted MFS family arabinose efflux permease